MVKISVIALLALGLVACAIGVNVTPTATAANPNSGGEVIIITEDADSTVEVKITQVFSTPEPIPTHTPTAVLTTSPTGKSLWHEGIIATVFWVGEEASAENDFIDNISSAWVTDWVSEYGGIDTPDERDPFNIFWPAGFTPKENSFYLALPASEFDETGVIPGAREASPWANEAVSSEGSLFKNRWVEVRLTTQDGKTVSCFGQWEDTGPGFDRQYDYVFGSAPVDNDFGLGAGIDLSPALAICLGAEQPSSWSGEVSWRFVDADEVPDGPWRQVITTSNPKW